MEEHEDRTAPHRPRIEEMCQIPLKVRGAELGERVIGFGKENGSEITAEAHGVLCGFSPSPTLNYVQGSLGQFLFSLLLPSSFQTSADLCLLTPPVLALKPV